MKTTVCLEIASRLAAIANCQLSNPWRERHRATIEALVNDFLPSGSGFDAGTQLDLDKSHADRLTFTTAFHHMDEHGGYNGWTEHTVTVRPAFIGRFDVRVSGRDRNQIKEFIADTFRADLSIEIEDVPADSQEDVIRYRRVA